MSFKLPDLIVESIIRDGLNNARRDETVIEDVFQDLTLSFASKKYGQAEIEKIKTVIRNKEVSVVHAFAINNITNPCISIHLSEDFEEESQAPMGGYQRNFTQPFTSPEKLAALVRVPSFTPTSYDSAVGTVYVPDGVNLAAVHKNLLFVDTDKNEFYILGGINNELGAKQFLIEAGATPTIGAGCEIKSSIDYDQFLQRGNAERTAIVLGIHTQEALLTKYLYTLVKYFILSRKRDMITRGFQLNNYSGSDFQRNQDFEANNVFSRHITLSGLVLHDWRSDKVQLIDNVDVRVKVPKDKLGNVALGLTDQTIQVKE